MKVSRIIKVLVVDDHPIVRHGLNAISDADQTMVIAGSASNGNEARALLRSIKPDVVLLDIRLGQELGLDLCREFKSEPCAPKVIVLTSFADAQLILDALAAGADGYLLKECDAHRIVEAIHTVLKGGTVFDPGKIAVASATPNPIGRPEQRLGELTMAELRVMAAVADGQTDKQVAMQLGLQPKTVRNHLDRIFQKLGVHTRTEAALAYHRSRTPPTV